MIIGVISDTHLQSPTGRLGEVIKKYFSNVDLILHAGDITAREVLDAFDGKEVIAVRGNNDAENLARRLPKKKVLTVNGLRIGLTHGWGFPLGLRKKVARAFDDMDCIVYGHSHWAVNQRVKNVLYFNPGAFRGGPSSFWRPSIGLLNVDREIHGEIIRI